MNILIDYRPNFDSVRDQGMRPTCIAFATSDGHSYALGQMAAFSSEYIFYHAAQLQLPTPHISGVSVTALINALETSGQPVESDYPYLFNMNASAPLPAPPQPPNIAVFKKKMLNRTGHHKDLISLLNNKIAPVICLNITEQFHFYKSDSPPIIYKNLSVRGRHALVVVGHGTNSTGESCVLLRNSWGTEWGQDGYGWVAESYINNHMYSFLSY